MDNCNKDSQSDDEISLPADTLKILNDFLLEKLERERKEEETIKENRGKDISFDENWQLSQFWYSEKTKTDLTKACRKIVSHGDKIGLLSCPSLYPSLKGVHDNVSIFEYDKRFASYGDDFIFYDFNEGDDPKYLIEHHKSFDVIIADPPFLSEECIQKISCFIKQLMKTTTKIIFCSGAVVEPWVRTYLDLKKCDYKPEHERNLGNEFVSYANFNLDEFL